LHLPGHPRRRAGAGGVVDRHEPLAPHGLDADDRLAEFRPLVTAVRWGALAVGVVLATPDISQRNWAVGGWLPVLLVYAVIRTIRPIEYRGDVRSELRIIADVGLNVVAVVATGYWDSPYVFCLLT